MKNTTPAKKLNIGIIGVGFMGVTHLFSINAIPFYFDESRFTVSVKGVCAAHYEKAEAFAKKHDIPVYTACEDDLIYDDEIDIIDICTPNIYHFETIKKAIEAGKHVLCEKPLCVTDDEALKLSELAKVAKEKGLVCGVVFNNRFLSPMIKARQLIESGKLGRILSFNAQYLHNSCLDVNKTAGWKQTSDFGGGVLHDLGSHALDLIYYTCGEFDSVIGMDQIGFPTRKGIDGLSWSTDAEEAFYALAILKNGAKGTVTASKLISGSNDDLSLEIYGTEGSLKFSLMDPNWLYFYDAKDTYAPGYTRIECVGRYGGSCVFPSPKASQGWIRGHIGSMYSYVECVAEGKAFAPSFDDAIHIHKAMSAARRSLTSSKFERV